MQDTFTVVDMAAWKRAVHCQVFREYVEPSYCVTFELDVTHFLGRVRSLGYSFTFSMVHLVTSCAQEIEEFRYRFLDGRVVLYKKINTACTYLDEQSDLFKVVNVPMQDSLLDYLAEADKRVRAQKEYFTGPLANNVFQFSPMPWLSYTHISHTISGKKDASTPLFDWGKYTAKDGKWMLPFSVQAHHSFVDGLHIAKLADSIQKRLDAF
ncbi:MAG: chloramphenicol acetyltransferase [Spirochaetales bacterium]|jgi:chloramphenicol O-acetyltransferase type B|nr:chloramphenicol acetyltransferase [Spirochaetales bacterium]